MNTTTSTNKGLVATATTIVHSPIERVWEALTDPEQIARYMAGARVTTDWKEGSSIEWKGEWEGKPYSDTGRIITVREPDLLKYTHRSGDGEEHNVAVELKEVGGVTHVRLTQDGNATEEARGHSEENWKGMLDGLKKMLGEAPTPKPDPQRR